MATKTDSKEKVEATEEVAGVSPAAEEKTEDAPAADDDQADSTPLSDEMESFVSYVENLTLLDASRLVKALEEEAHLIHVGLDQDGDVFVKVELPGQDFEFEQFVYVLFNLCQVSEQLMVPVLQAHAFDKYEETDSLGG